MHSSQAFTTLLAVRWTYALAVQLPTRNGPGILEMVISAGQQPLLEQSGSKTSTLEIEDVDGWIYRTTISVGKPPLTYKVAIDTCWSDTFLPSVRCLEGDSADLCASHPLYNSTASSTYKSTDQREVAVARGGYHTSGQAAKERFRIGNLQIEDQTFEEADDFRPTYVFDDTTYDTVLGLSRETVRSNDSTLQAASPFQNLVSQKSLERNMFSLSLPRNPTEKGRLTLGGVDQNIDESSANTLSLPLSTSASDTNSSSFGGWEVGAVSITLGSGSEAIHYPLSSYVAILSTASPVLDLPNAFVRDVQRRVGASMIDGTVECDEVSSLPNLTISLRGQGGSVHDFVMTPQQYTGNDLKLPIYDPDRCLVLLAPREEDDKDGRGSIVLGAAFLKHYHAIFDADQQTVSLRSRSA